MADELISKQQVCEVLAQFAPENYTQLVEMLVVKLPAVDAVEVVRCKDCAQWGGVTYGNVCRRWSAPLAGMKNCTSPDDFCSYGERREENER